MSVMEVIKDTLYSGDPLVRTWFLVESNTIPFISSFVYVLFVKKVGPAIMKNREPFDLRRLMIVYNFFVVFAYSASILFLLSLPFWTPALDKICEKAVITKDNWTFLVANVAWVIYALKYLEFADTIFFVLRKKNRLITNLHVIHHAALPIIAWVFIRTETTGFQLFPAGLNSFIHIIMYSYYGLAAMGPEVQKYLWWKVYLTQLQMLQFVIIILFVLLIVPLSGCQTTQHGIYIEILFALIFLALFYNFYKQTYKKKPLKQKEEVNGVENSKLHAHCNGKSNSTNYYQNGTGSKSNFGFSNGVEREIRKRLD